METERTFIDGVLQRRGHLFRVHNERKYEDGNYVTVSYFTQEKYKPWKHVIKGYNKTGLLHYIRCAFPFLWYNKDSLVKIPDSDYVTICA